jgi:hypothetical protein
MARNCKVEATGIGAVYQVEQCTNYETQAKNELTKRWAKFSTSQKKNCVETSSIEGGQSYIELLTCLEWLAASSGHLNKDKGPQDRSARYDAPDRQPTFHHWIHAERTLSWLLGASSHSSCLLVSAVDISQKLWTAAANLRIAFFVGFGVSDVPNQGQLLLSSSGVLGGVDTYRIHKTIAARVTTAW